MRNRKVLVANSYDGSLTTPSSTQGLLVPLPVNASEVFTSFNTPGSGGTLVAATYPKLVLSVGKGTRYAPEMIELIAKNIISVKSVAYSGGTQKVIYGGYAGSGSGQLAVNLYDDYEYGIRIMTVDSENTGTKWEPAGKYYSTISPANTSSAAHGRYNLLKTLVETINDNYWDSDTGVIAKLVHSETQTAESHSVTLTIANGSTTGTLSSGTVDFAIGDFLSIKGDLYKITNLASTTVTLDRPFGGASVTTLATGTTKASQYGWVASTTVDENTLFGIFFTGDADLDFTVSFEEGFDGGEEGVVNTNLAYSVGTYDEVSAEEELSDSSFGITSKTGVLPAERIKNATSGYTYDKYIFTVNDRINGVDMEKEYVLYVKVGITTSSGTNYFYAYLNAWIASMPSIQNGLTNF